MKNVIMKNLREESDIWAKQLFEEQLNDIEKFGEKDCFQEAKEAFIRLNIYKKPVNGYACEGLPKTEENRTGVSINYTDVFHNVCIHEFTPTKYLFELVRIFLNSGAEKNKLDGFLARGLRTLTSLLREPDFAERILVYLKIFDTEAVTELCPKQDAVDHTDVLIRFKGEIYRVWLFQFSERGLPHDIERITGKRGELPDGFHVLCPLKTELALEYVKHLRKQEKISKRLELEAVKLEKCSLKALKRREAIIEKVETLKEIKKEVRIQLGQEKERMQEELDVVNGWFFYSNKYLKKVAEALALNANYDLYENVREKFLWPEKYLRDVRFFKKESFIKF